MPEGLVLDCGSLLSLFIGDSQRSPNSITWKFISELIACSILPLGFGWRDVASDPKGVLEEVWAGGSCGEVHS